MRILCYFIFVWTQNAIRGIGLHVLLLKLYNPHVVLWFVGVFQSQALHTE